jgi:hypothetical protein
MSKQLSDQINYTAKPTSNGDWLAVQFMSVGLANIAYIRVTQLTDANKLTSSTTIFPIPAISYYAMQPIPLTAGYLYSISVQIADPQTQPNEILCRLVLHSGHPSTGKELEMLVTGTVQPTFPLIWPQTQEMPAQKNFLPLYITPVADPAAGSNFNYYTNYQRRHQIQSIRFTLTTSAQIAVRRPQITLDDNTTTACIFVSASTQSASLSQTYQWIAGYPIRDTSTIITEPFPTNFEFRAGWHLRSLVENIQTSDQISYVVIFEKRTLM